SCSSGTAHSEGAIFTLDEKNFTREDLPGELKELYYNDQHQSYQKTRGIAEDFALRLALSKTQDPKSLPQLEELLPSAKVSESEVKKFYEEKKASIPPQVTYEQVRPQIENFLRSQRVATLANTELKRLESSGRYKLLLNAPVPPVASIDIAPYPSLGPKDAKYTLVEASDYMCGHCQQVHPEVKQVLEKYKDKIKFVQINYSLNPAGMSGTWIRGAYCAAQENQEKFWKYHHAAFEKQSSEVHDHSAHAHGEPADDPATNLKKANDIAKSVGLDTKKFASCIDSEAAKAFVVKTNQMLSNNGVGGTPTFFFNNVKLQMTHAGLTAALESAMQAL
ncbi:MAG: thioredoxin domain-containing protein, partial [Bdellovibrio sp.]|nr:thioredoxin domain-containing protein [Bdellovibrio sp.]